MKGKIIEINGLDCSFKETNTKKLEEYIKTNITEKVKLVSFPNYNSESSYFIKKYLSGTYKDITPKNISLLYALDRFDTVEELHIKELVDDGYYIIFDRYTGSNALYQTCNMDSNYDKLNYLTWLYELEETHLQLPKSDIQILLLNHTDLIYSLLSKRESKSVNNDIIENDKEIMYKIYNNANFISDILRWETIKCFNEYSNGVISKSKDEIFKNILETLYKYKII